MNFVLKSYHSYTSYYTVDVLAEFEWSACPRGMLVLEHQFITYVDGLCQACGSDPKSAKFDMASKMQYRI